MTTQYMWGDRCYNPFKRKSHGKGSDLRNISKALLLKLPGNIPVNGKLCRSCRRELMSRKLLVLQSENHTQAANIDYDDHYISHNDINFTDTEDVKDSNFSVPSTSKRLNLQCDNKYHTAAVEVLEQIKDKFQKSASSSEKLLLLTLAPKSWDRNKIATEFGTSERQAQRAKELVSKHGILTFKFCFKIVIVNICRHFS